MTLGHFLAVSTLLLAAGILTLLTKRHAVGILMGIELILNAAMLNLVAFHAFAPHTVSPPVHPAQIAGPMFAFFIILLAAAQAVIVLAICLNFHQHAGSLDVEAATNSGSQEPPPPTVSLNPEP